MFIAISLLLATFQGAPLNPSHSCTTAIDKEFCTQILPMADSVDPRASYAWLQDAIKKRGFPTKELVGEYANNIVITINERAAKALPDYAVVARMWRGRVKNAHADEYQHYLEEAGLTKLRAIKGNLGAEMHRRALGDGTTEFVVISYWPSRDAIHAYAGADIEKVHDLPRDKEFLIDPDRTVRNFDSVLVKKQK
jgi:heme-degrading monooxygenase HmoA